MIGLSLRLLRRDWRAGELRVLLAALLIAVTSVTSVSFFTSRISQALIYQSSELLGADLRFVSDHPLKQFVFIYAAQKKLKIAETRSFRSMIISGDKIQLAEVKAAGEGYPLRGKLRIASSPFSQDRLTNTLPASGEAWADSRLLQKMGLSIGDIVRVGHLQVRISALLSYEPDRSGDMFSLAPRLLINLLDMAATGLEQEGSRIRYALLLAGNQHDVEVFRQEVAAKLARGERTESAADARREIRLALGRAQQFLGLSSVVAVILAYVAIAMAARRYAQRHLGTCAIVRCLGARQNQVTQLFFTQLIVIGFLAGTLGVILGYCAQIVLAKLLGSLLLVALPSPSIAPVVIGMCVSFAGLIGFALPPIVQLRNVPIMRILFQSYVGIGGKAKPVTLASYLLGLMALSALVFQQAGEIGLGLWLLLGLAGTVVILWLVSTLLVMGVRNIARHGSSAWRFGLKNLTRRRRSSVSQVMAFGVGLTVMLLLTVVRGDLLRSWENGIPSDAPNRFVINIQPDQLDSVRSFFAEKGLDAVTFYPMVRGRLTHINNKSVNSEDFQDQRTKNLVDREFNLSWSTNLQSDNVIEGGLWWGESDTGKRIFSVEKEIAKSLGISVGDQLTYDIAGNKLTAEVTSLRSVRWDSMRANFFVLSPPGVLDNFPASYITSFYLGKDRTQLLDELVKDFPNLTIIDIAAVLDQIRSIIDRISLAVEYIFFFTLAAGLTVMYAAIQSTLDERLREGAILRALGARRSRLWKSTTVEFVALGSLAGLVAAIIASVLGFGVARYVFELEYIVNLWLWVNGMLIGGLGVGISGIIGTRKVMNHPPLSVLRRV